MSTQPKAKKPISTGRHSRNCTVCAHKCREDIEREFINWTGAKTIAKEFGLKDRTSVFRHAHAFGLFAKRQRNIRAALEKIIEHSGDVEVTSSAVVAAVQAYAKINSQGQWVDRNEHVNVNELFERMSEEEMEMYATEGTLPNWFKVAVSATPHDSEEDKNEG
jgi:hypothetical protein